MTVGETWPGADWKHAFSAHLPRPLKPLSFSLCLIMWDVQGCHLVVLICSTCSTLGFSPSGWWLWRVCPHRVVIIRLATVLFRIGIQSVYTTGKPLSSMVLLSWDQVCIVFRAMVEGKKRQSGGEHWLFSRVNFQRVYVSGVEATTQVKTQSQRGRNQEVM